MIKELIKIHDKFSIEIKLGYETKRSKKKNDFTVNTWFFVPNSLDVNRHTYSKDQFYNDLKTNIRLTTPVYLLREIAEGKDSPIHFLEKAFMDLANTPIRKNREKYEYHLKMFQSIIKSSLRNDINHIISNVVSADRQYLITSYLENTKAVLKKYRELRRIINVPTINDELLSYYLLSDEFMSNIVEQHTFYLVRDLEKKYPKDYQENQSLLLALIQSEISYKESKGYATVKKRTKDNNGSVIYRRGVLKKYIESQLFLSTRQKKDGVVVEQFLYSIAAGLSMIFATGVAFTFQLKYGNFTMPFFIALVVGYMLKDRIKELTRYYLGGKLQKRLFDLKNSIVINDHQKIGWCKESFDFIKEDNTPKNVLKVRSRSQIMEVENRGAEEKIILYRKLVRINRNELNNVYEQYEITGINDIIRFNISRFVKKMDNPKIPIYILKDNSYQITKGDKLYYLNFVMKFEYNDESKYSRYRIVFNRNGIKKVEKM